MGVKRGTASAASRHAERSRTDSIVYPLVAAELTAYPCAHMEASKRNSRNGGTRDGQHVALVHDRLRDAILRGEIPAGQTTSQVTLARDLEVGRTPLREALRHAPARGPRRLRAEPARADRRALERGRGGALRHADRPRGRRGPHHRPDASRRPTSPSSRGSWRRWTTTCARRTARACASPHRAFHDRLVARGGRAGDAHDRPALRPRRALPAARTAPRPPSAGTSAAPSTGRSSTPPRRATPTLAARHLVEHYAHTARFVFAALDPGHDLIRLRTTMETVAPGSEAALELSDRG